MSSRQNVVAEISFRKNSFEGCASSGVSSQVLQPLNSFVMKLFVFFLSYTPTESDLSFLEKEFILPVTQQRFKIEHCTPAVTQYF